MGHGTTRVGSVCPACPAEEEGRLSLKAATQGREADQLLGYWSEQRTAFGTGNMKDFMLAVSSVCSTTTSSVVKQVRTELFVPFVRPIYADVVV